MTRNVRTRRRPNRTQVAALVVATGAVVASAVLAWGSGGAGAVASKGPTTAAQARDLRVTDSEPGALARADTTTVLYDGTGGRDGGGPVGSDPVTAQSSDQAVPAQIEPDPATSTTTTTAPSTATDGTQLCPPYCSTGTSIPSGPVGPDGSFNDVDPAAEDPVAEDPVADGPTDADAPTAQEGDLGPAQDGTTGEGDETNGSGSSTATLTELLAVGQTATRGSVLYRADDEPIVALLSTTPLFRELRAGVDDGADVLAIESELRALGYGGFTVDEHYDSATAAAVEEWEEDLGRGDADGVVTVGEVQLLDEATTVLEHKVAVGDLLEPGDAVVVLGTESRVVEADIEAAETADWTVGTTVSVDWGDGTSATGTITEVGRDVADAQVDIVVSLGGDAGADRSVGARVDVVRTVAERSGAVSVPVSAIVDGAKGPAVRVAGAEDDRLVAVELGIVDDGWVEVTSGLAAGTEVRLPA